MFTHSVLLGPNWHLARPALVLTIIKVAGSVRKERRYQLGTPLVSPEYKRCQTVRLSGSDGQTNRTAMMSTVATDVAMSFGHPGIQARAAPSPPERLADERRVQHAVRALSSRAWDQRLQPLAVHIADRQPGGHVQQHIMSAPVSLQAGAPQVGAV